MWIVALCPIAIVAIKICAHITMCHTPAKSWLEYVGFIKTDNTAYPAFSWGVAISFQNQYDINQIIVSLAKTSLGHLAMNNV